MSNGNLNWIANFIWGIADDVLRDIYVRGKYRDVILPMTVIRRLDAVLEPTKPAVLSMKKQLDAVDITHQDAALQQTSGQAFYNTSPYTLRDLRARAKTQQLKADFEAYLEGFSPNVQEILDKFKFHNQIPTLIGADILGNLIEKFLDPTVNLSPNPMLNSDDSIRLPALDNHAMGTIFEELIRRFNEENNEEAGEHFTPRDVVRLMADLIFLPIADQIESGAYLVYDGACGTGGMLTVAEARLTELARRHGKEVSIHLFGQEVNPDWIAAALGAAYTLAERVADAVSLLRQAMEQGVAEENVSFQALCCLPLSEAQLLAGRWEEAHALAEHTLALARTHQERGHQAYALHVLGDIAARRVPSEVEQAEAHYQQALALAEALGMRPLVAHCHQGLAQLYCQTGRGEEARVALSAAIDLYRAMDMTFWLPQAETALAQVEGR